MTLYLGTDPSSYRHIENLIHYPVIKTIPLKIPQPVWDDFFKYTHLIFTSKNGVAIFFEALRKTSISLEELKKKQLLAIGKSTASKLAQEGCPPHLIAEDECQEGMIELLSRQDLKNAYIFYPRSSLARKNLERFLIDRGVKHHICDLYQTVFQKPEPVPDLRAIEEIIFTSPSTIKGFIAAFGSIPQDKKLTCIGTVTEAELKNQ